MRLMDCEHLELGMMQIKNMKNPKMVCLNLNCRKQWPASQAPNIFKEGRSVEYSNRKIMERLSTK